MELPALSEKAKKILQSMQRRMHRNKRKGLYFLVAATCLKLMIAFWLVNGCASHF